MVPGSDKGLHLKSLDGNGRDLDTFGEYGVRSM